MQKSDGSFHEYEADHFLSSIPLTELVTTMDPPAPEEVLAACRRLHYRHHIAVNLKIAGRPFPDNWIYVHSKEVKMARVVNYRNFSKDMADSPNVSPITVEYFAFHDDELWSRKDHDLIQLAVQELEDMKLTARKRIPSLKPALIGLSVRSRAGSTHSKISIP